MDCRGCLSSHAAIGCSCGEGRSTTSLSPNPATRRHILQGMIGAAIVGFSHRARAQSELSPDAALDQLMAGNRRFVDKRMTSFDEDLAILKQNTAAKQAPFAAVLSCADSRVPTELIFDQSIGHIFVTRVAGNVATNDMIASLEYGAAVLGTKAIVVMAHSNCGAAKAAIAGQSVPGQISGLYPYLRGAVEQSGPDIDAVARTNARIQANLLATASPVIGGLIGDRKIKVAAAFYDLHSGIVSLL